MAAAHLMRVCLRASCGGGGRANVRRSSAKSTARRSLASAAAPTGFTAFFGLGTMGAPLAANIRRRRAALANPLVVGPFTTADVLVWNRTVDKAITHATQYGTCVISENPEVVGLRRKQKNSTSKICGFEALQYASSIFTCLPTSQQVREVLNRLVEHLKTGTVVVDCTSGHPRQSRAIADWLRDEYGIIYVDCAVSGGPAGASDGTVAAFVGCDDENALATTLPDVESFAKKIIHLGPAGAGHATKAINNAMNTTNMLCAAEGMLALQKLGVDPAKALDVVNSASGRSLMTLQRLPEEVLSRKFAYGFKISLMRKDLSIANDLLDDHFPDATVFRETARLVDAALELDEVGADSDYTEAVKILEHRAGAHLQSDTPVEHNT